MKEVTAYKTEDGQIHSTKKDAIINRVHALVRDVHTHQVIYESPSITLRGAIAIVENITAINKIIGELDA